MAVKDNSIIAEDWDVQLPDYVDEEQLREALGEEGLRRIESRYLNRDNNGRINETAGIRFYKVARTIAEVESRYGAGAEEIDQLTRQFYNLMAGLDFLPAGRILSNVSSSVGSLFNCYVLPVPDDLPGIMNKSETRRSSIKAGVVPAIIFRPCAPAECMSRNPRQWLRGRFLS